MVCLKILKPEALKRLTLHQGQPEPFGTEVAKLRTNNMTNTNQLDNLRIAVIGLGYVGLPLAIEFGKKYPTIGFDINEKRVHSLKAEIDNTREVEKDTFKLAKQLSFTSNPMELTQCNFFIVAVPTPINTNKSPNLDPLKSSSKTIGAVLKKNDIVVYESTVYPGCTEEICVPVLESESNLEYNKDFYCGYSPERINPGDKVNTLTKIKKVTSGSTKEIGEFIDSVYKTIITAGTHLAPSMKVAEAAKVIENCQRDVNISFMNELALLFDRLDIDTNTVLEAASTKWNFLPFKPGLVGGHCISVDPYYLTFKAEEIGYHPEVILSGRRINDNMGRHIAAKVIKLLIHKGHSIKNSKCLILGVSFKENCPDIRNSKVVDIASELQDFGVSVDVYDPWVSAEECKKEYQLELINELEGPYDAIVLAVAHNEFKQLNLTQLLNKDGVIYDVKAILPKEMVDGRL
jgi:UDP-N-acetyl-D-glucosamine/UDP-N-acetyl-D-galactosamine dehydrogenase